MDVHVNAAMSADGKLSSARREQVTISGPEDLDRVDALRAGVDGVAVGVGTVLADDPSLTVDDPDRIVDRTDAGRPAQPARVVADSRGRVPLDARVLDDTAPSYVLTSQAATADRVAAYESAGAKVIVAGTHRVDLAEAFEALAAEGVGSLLVEGGGELIFSLFEIGVVDRLTVYIGPIVVGGRDAPTLADGEGFLVGFQSLELKSVDRLDDGAVLEYTVP